MSVGIPRVRRFPKRPITRAVDPCAVAAAGNRVFGKRYARIAHCCFTPELVLALDKADVWPTVFTYTQNALASMPLTYTAHSNPHTNWNAP